MYKVNIYIYIYIHTVHLLPTSYMSLSLLYLQIIMEYACGICDGGYQFRAKYLARRHILEQHSGFGNAEDVMEYSADLTPNISVVSMVG